jgi:putative transposase
VRRHKPPSQTWRTFLDNHVKTMVSVDFFTVPTIRFQVLYVFLVLAHDRRRVLHFGVTDHPTAEWTVQQLREAFPWETAPRYLLRDRDRIFGADFVQQVEAIGIKQVLSAPRSPWQRAYAGQVIGTIRRKCVDHVTVLSEAGLSRHLRRFADYYHRSRTHRACKRTRPSYAPSKHQKPRGSSRSQRWVGYIIVTNVAPPERRRVEPQPQTTLLSIHRRLSLRRGPADRGDVD